MAREYVSAREALRRRNRQRPKGKRYEPSMAGRGMTMTDENLTFIPAETQLRLLRDQMIIAPMDVLHSRILIIPPHSSVLIRGKVLAAGPGYYPNRYDHSEKHKRTKVMAGTVFVPMSVKVGDVVHLDGRQTGKSAFDAFYWGDKYCIHCRQEDVAGVEI
jgi:hypothetical protein